MSARICPKCFNTLNSNNHYFCGYCGEILPSSLTIKPVIKNMLIANYDVLSQKNFLGRLQKILVSKIFIAIFLVFVFVIGLVSLFFITNTEDKKYVNKVIPEVKECSGELTCGTFGYDQIVSVVPENVILYAEGFDYPKLAQFLLDYDVTYSDLIDDLDYLESKHISMFVEQIEGKFYYTFVLYSNKEPSGKIMELINNSKKIFVGRIDKYYIVSTRNNVLGDMQKVKEGISKNFGQNNLYAITINKNKKAQILIMLINNNGREVIEKILANDKVPVYIRNLIDKLSQSKSNYIVY